MPSSHALDRLEVTFDDAHAVANAGLLLPAILTQRLGLEALADELVDLGGRPGVQTFPFERAGEAYRISQSGHVRGKLVLVPEAPTADAAS